MEISIEPWKKLVIHEVIEYKFDDWVNKFKGRNQKKYGHILRDSIRTTIDVSDESRLLFNMSYISRKVLSSI